MHGDRERESIPVELIVRKVLKRAGLGLPSDALDDCASEAHLAVWRASQHSTGAGPATRRAYAVKCVENAVLGWITHERERRLPFQLVSLNDMADSDEYDSALGEWTAAADERMVVAAALARLATPTQEPLHFRFHLQLTDSEVADRLRITPSTARARRVAAFNKLRVELGEPEG